MAAYSKHQKDKANIFEWGNNLLLITLRITNVPINCNTTKVYKSEQV